mgnify:CR=1 FL=1
MSIYQKLKPFVGTSRKIVPDDVNLWETTNAVNKGKPHDHIINEYERMGGRYKVYHNKVKDMEEDSAVYAQVMDEKNWDYIKSIKETDPTTWNRMRNWE